MIESINSPVILDMQAISSLQNNAPQPFSDKLMAEISSVNSKLNAAEVSLQDLAAGKSGNIHHVMLALEDAKMSFQLLVQVRNKLLDSYQDVLRMQI